MTPGLLGGLLSRGPSEKTVTALESALDEHTGADERAQYRLSGSGTLVHETDNGSEETGANGLLAVVTDHQVLFAVVDDEASVVEVPYTEVRAAEVDSGLFSTVLTVECWEEGSYQFQVAGGDAGAAAEYVEQASDCWQFVETLLDELESHAERIQTATEQRAFDRVTEALDEAGETTAELEGRVQTAGLENALGGRVEAARRNLQRTRVRTRRELARERITEAEARHLDGQADYAGAYERYERAHVHLSTAHTVVQEHDLETGGVERALEGLAERVEFLARQPVALAKQATERARHTDDPAVRVETTQAALGHYHDALTVGWGTGLDRPYGSDELRFRVALLADGVVDARREYATRLEAAGNALAEEGDDEAARERYRAAVEQLDAAVDTAHEFRVPDPGPVQRERSRIGERATDG